MCGIVGVLEFGDRPVPGTVLGQMTAALSHRGPDGQGIQVLDEGRVRVGLGQARLKVIDLSDAAAQPMTNEDRSVWLVFNGEIYNFRELRASLIARGIQFRTSSDTEVILRLYEAQGRRCVDALDGMFAFALWDARDRTLLLARDRVGKKPLFYYSTPRLFAFASEIKALFRHPEIVPEVDAEMLPAFFLYGYVPTPATLYRGIRKLPPGHVLHVDHRAGVCAQEYWDLSDSLKPSDTSPSEAEAQRSVRALLTGAVRRRLIADVPLGAFLSGGIDSTVVVGIMGQLIQQPVRTFSVGFEGDQRFDERRYARLAAQRFGTAHTELIVAPEAIELVERLVWHHDGPFADSSAVPTYILSRLAREHVTVALNGDGGDELFAGYRRFYAALISERLPAWARYAGGRLSSSFPQWRGDRNLIGRLKNYASTASLPFLERFSRLAAIFYDDLARLLPGVRDHGGAPAPLALLEPLLRRCEGASLLNRLLYLNFKTYLLDDLLVKMDRCSMAHGLEARSPLLDRALLEYVFALPDVMKLRWWRTKVIFRQAFSDLVPPEILGRRKMGFGVPLRAWFRESLPDYLQDLLLAPDARLRNYVDQSYVRELRCAHLTNRADHSSRLWTLLTFEVWLRSLSGWATSSAAQEG